MAVEVLMEVQVLMRPEVMISYLRKLVRASTGKSTSLDINTLT